MKMKRNIQQLFSYFLCVSFLLTAVFATAQEELQGDRFVKMVKLSPFSKVDALGGAYHIYFKQGDHYVASIEGDQIAVNRVEIDQQGELIDIYSKGSLSYSGELKVIITAPNIKAIDLGGVCHFYTTEGSKLTGDNITLDLQGAAFVKAEIDASNLTIDASGASSVELSGKALNTSIDASGAADLRMRKLNTVTANVEASGASDIDITVEDDLIGETSGVANLVYNNDVKRQSVNEHSMNSNDGYVSTGRTGEKTVKVGGVGVYVDDDESRVRVNAGGINVETYEGDSVNIDLGGRRYVIDDFGNIKVRRRKGKRKFDGHFAGFELGVNGYVNSDFNMDFGPAYSYMDLRMEKSGNVNINFLEQNFAFSKKGNFGFLTGIGLSINNYRFSHQTHLDKEGPALRGYYIKGTDLRKTKIVNTWLTVPALFEWQTRSYRRSKRFFVQAGVQFGLRVQTHTKEYFENTGQPFDYVDPVTGQVIESYPGSGDRKVKQHDSFYMNPVKLDASVRLGWGFINLYGTYSLTRMFQKDKGPELYPFSLGLILVSW